MKIRIRLAICTAIAAMVMGGMAGPSVAGDKRPPKFQPNDQQCQANPDQPRCPGKH